MSQVVTNAGEVLFAQKAQANEQLDIDTFIFAYVPGQDSQAPVERSEGLPPTAQKVHTQTVQQVGRINSNTVVYSTVLNSLTGPFEFNWVGLYSSVNNTLVAISHVKSVNKTITELGTAGNTLNRNFAIEYSGISDITGITVAPETWQLDFSARLAGMDALTQNLAMDMNGRDWFIGDGFKVEPTANDDEFRVIAGVGYVHGMRVELENDYIFSVQTYPQFVYVDAYFDGNASSQWKPKVEFTVSNAEMDGYIDESGIQHYVLKLADISSSINIEDLRKVTGLAQKVTDIESKSPSAALFNKSIGVNSVNLPVSLFKNINGANQDRHVMLFGDSHGWGQGAPQHDLSGSTASNVSVHSSPINNQGFMRRVKDFLDTKLNCEVNHYGAGSNQITSDITMAHSSNVYTGDPENVYPIIPLGGNVSSTYEPMGDASETNEKWFAPDTRVGNGDDYSYNIYRDKLQGGLFKRAVMKLEQAAEDDFTTIGRNRYWEILPSKNSVSFGSGFVDIVHQNLSGGSSVYPVLGARDTATGRVFVNSAMKKPNWLKKDAEVFIVGYGYMLIDYGSTNNSLEFKNLDGTPATSEFSKLIASGTRVYPAALAKGLLMIEMRKPARVMYLHVIEKSGGGNMRVGFVNNINNGYVGYPQIDETAIFTRSANPWAQRLSSGTMGVFKVNPDSSLSSNPSNVVRDTFGFKIDTDNGGAEKEVIYRVDFGAQQQGRLFIAFDTVSNTAGTETFETRGVIFDNNKIQNYSMGGHTVGAWLGDESSFSNETRNHLDDILNYTQVKPSHVITQIPFVNEYLKQTPIATFKARLKAFADKLSGHLATTNNYNSVGIDFMFFTSLRNRGVAFEGVTSDPVSYDMYVQATKEFCEDNNHAFVDCEKELFRMVESGRVSYERLYSNSNHPSDFANEIIFKVLTQDYLDFIC